MFSHALKSSIAAAALAAAMSSVPAIAQERTYDFALPAQDLQTSLKAFARVSGQQISFDGSAVRGKRAPALKGSFTVRDGIARLLAGSGLEASRGRSGILVIRPAAKIADASGAAYFEAQAAEAPADDIIVTGSRIARQVVTDSPVPIVAINEEDIQSSGATELSEILADYPGVTPGTNLANSNSQINAAGISSIDLRSLGSDRTLTLIDGRRTVSNRITANTVSLSSIPTLFVERVEVITGGASAVYGSDAIAGVVNIITRDKFDGVRLGGRAGISSRGDSQRLNLDLLVGQKFLDDRASLVAGASYEKEAGVMGSQRARTLESLSYSQSADGNPDNQGDLGINRPARSSSTPGGRFLSSSTAGGGYFVYDADGNLYRATSSAVYGWETRPDLQFSAPRTSYLAAAKLTADLGSGIEAFAQVQYSKIKTRAARGGAETAAYDDEFGDPNDLDEVGRIPRNNPFVPDEIRALASSSGVQWSRRFTELGDYQILNDRQTWRGWAGLRGKIGDNWNWELSYGYGRFHQQQDRINVLNFQNLQYALNAEYDPAAPGDLSRVRCVDADARAAGCKPINIFGPGSITKEAADYVRADLILDGLMRQDVVQGYMSGALFELPAGPLSVAFGGEYRRDWQRSTTDPVTRQGFGSASFIAEYEGNIKAKEAFVEVNIPVLRDQPFFHRLSLDAAARYGDYNIRNVGSVFSYRFGGEWAPVADIRFRGQYARAQRAPTVTNLYSPLRDDADSVVDLCSGVTAATAGTVADNCRSIPGIAAEIAANGVFLQDTTGIKGPSSGNPDLKEETADTLSLGAVLTPTFLRGLSLTVDYFKIKVRDAISSLDADQLLRECLGNPDGLTDNFFCNEITRNGEGQITQIINRDLNLNKIVRSGIDVGLDYRFDAPQWLSSTGKFDVRLLYSRLLDFYTVFDGVNGVSTTDSKGEIGAWVNTGQAQFGYRDGGLRLRWKIRYTGKAVDSNQRLAVAEAAGSNPPFLHVGDRVRHDFYASLEVPSAGRDFRIYTGVNNVFDSKSPFLPTGTVSGSSQNITGDYDEIGRYFYVGFEAKF
jgi:outer membrane receptor protein involved in Fe transport